MLSFRLPWPRIARLTIISGVGLAGYLLGKYSSDPKSSYVKELIRLRKQDAVFINSVLAEAPIIREQGLQLPQIISKDVNLSKVNEYNNVQHPNRIAEIMKYGFPSLENIRSYDNFVLSYDKRNRIANWVLEHLTKDMVKKNDQVDRTKCEFFEDMSIHPYFRATNADYKRSGFDRGHLAAAGNHKSNQKTCEQTFILSNMAPQVGEGFNRNIWNTLEKHVRKLARKYPNVYVCTGPLFLPRIESDGKSFIKYQVIGVNTVAVPTHFFKVIVMEAADRSLEMEAYVMPNQPIADGIPISSFQVPIESIERASGLLLFDKIPRKNLKRINGK